MRTQWIAIYFIMMSLVVPATATIHVDGKAIQALAEDGDVLSKELRTRNPNEVEGNCQFRVVKKGTAEKPEICLYRAAGWILPKDKSQDPEALTLKAIRSDVVPTDNTMWASFGAKQLKVHGGRCEAQDITPTEEIEERVAILSSFPLSIPTESEPILHTQCLNGESCNTFSLQGYHQGNEWNVISRLVDAADYPNCSLPVNDLTDYYSTIQVHVLEDGRAMLRMMQYSCFDKKSDVENYEAHSEHIQDLYCADEDSKFQILERSLKEK